MLPGSLQSTVKNRGPLLSLNLAASYDIEWSDALGLSDYLKEMLEEFKEMVYAEHGAWHLENVNFRF